MGLGCNFALAPRGFKLRRRGSQPNPPPRFRPLPPPPPFLIHHSGRGGGGGALHCKWSKQDVALHPGQNVGGLRCGLQDLICFALCCSAVPRNGSQVLRLRCEVPGPHLLPHAITAPINTVVTAAVGCSAPTCTRTRTCTREGGGVAVAINRGSN